MRARGAARIAAISESETIATPRVGKVVRFDGGNLVVDFPGNPRGPVTARVSASAGRELYEEAGQVGAEALLLFENGDPAKPVVLCLLCPPGTMAAPSPSNKNSPRIGGRRVSVEGHEEVVMRSGASSLTLRRDGTVVLRGVRVKTEASETNRIRGGKVKIN